MPCERINRFQVVAAARKPFVMRRKHKQPTETAKRKYLLKQFKRQHMVVSFVCDTHVDRFRRSFFRCVRHLLERTLTVLQGKNFIFNNIVDTKSFICIDFVKKCASIYCQSLQTGKSKVFSSAHQTKSQLRNCFDRQVFFPFNSSNTIHHAVIKRIFHTILLCLYVTTSLFVLVFELSI